MTDAVQTAPLTRRDLEAKLVAKAWTDEEFRARFLADPKAVLEEYLGTKLPETLAITVHQEEPESLHLVIPHKPEVDLDGLSDEDLENIAGGYYDCTRDQYNDTSHICFWVPREHRNW